MMQENKELLLRDLCGRLPYGVKCNIGEKEIYTLCRIEVDDINGHLLDFIENKDGLDMQVYLSEIKPYLFPLSSMTEEQESYLHFNTKFKLDICNDLTVKNDEDDNYFYTDIYDYSSLIDWCNKNHFDYRGLIEKGLAKDATNLNIY